jgi:hypothetical protein
MNPIDDTSVIRRFVQDEVALVANSNLRVEPVFNTAQLIAKKGGLIASAKLAGQIRSVLLRHTSTYGELVDRILVENGYIPTGTTAQGLAQYERRQIPAGYAANCTEARLLWKLWRSHSKSNVAQPPLQVLTLHGWEAVETIAFGQESFFVRVASQEMMLHTSDRVVWLNPVLQSQVA